VKSGNVSQLPPLHHPANQTARNRNVNGSSQQQGQNQNQGGQSQGNDSTARRQQAADGQLSEPQLR
jgi:hypothetical protein